MSTPASGSCGPLSLPCFRAMAIPVGDFPTLCLYDQPDRAEAGASHLVRGLGIEAVRKGLGQDRCQAGTSQTDGAQSYLLSELGSQM